MGDTSAEQPATSSEPATPSEPTTASKLWVRAFWAFPLGAALMGLVEVILQARRIGWDLVSVVLSLFSASWAGIVPGTLLLLALLLAHSRFGWRPPRVAPRFVAIASIVALGTLAVIGVGWVLGSVATSVVAGRPLHFRAAEVPLIRGAVFVGAIPSVLGLYLAMRAGEEWLVRHAWVGWVGKLAFAAVMFIGCFQLFSDQMVYYYGDVAPPVILGLFAGLAAWWLPREVADNRRNRVAMGTAVAAMLGLGLLGLHHASARGILFHDTRTFPRAFGTYLSMFDVDGDQDFPAWLGGTDCDNFDPMVSGWRIEIPGNGLDDNCFGGDREPTASAPPKPVASGDRPPVFLVTIDTVGASHLDLYGYERATMPALTALAQSSRWYRNAYAPSNQTYFSTVATLSGQSPEKMMSPEDGEDPERLRFTFWLPHRLAALGYRTVAFAPPLYDLQKMRIEDLRFDEVDMVKRDYVELGRGTNSKAVVDAALEYVKRHGDERPLFSWIHLIDPHAVHEAPQVFPISGPADVWDSELAYVDAELARLFAGLQEEYGRDVIIIVTADHGEQFGERGFFGHAFSLFDGVTRVPLVVYSPGIETGVEERPVSVLGVVPTVLALLGQEQDPRLSSPPLVGDVDPGPVLSYAPFYGEYEHRMEVAIVDWPYKLIRNRRSGTSLMFNLEDDPGETDNLAGREPDKRQELEQALFELLEAQP